MMMTMIMMINVFCRIADRRKVLNLVSTRDQSQKFTPSWISNAPKVGFKPVQNLGSNLTTKPQHHTLVAFYK